MSTTNTVPTSTHPNTGAARGFYNCPETPEPVALSVTGEIPPWLSGILYRTGPGTYSIPHKKGSQDKTFETRHWFDGFTLNHRFEIKDGGVMYRSKSGSKAMEEYVREHGRLPPGGSFGQADPCETVLGQLFTKFKQTILPPAPGRTGADSQNIGVTITPHFNGYSSSFSSSEGGILIVKTDVNVIQQLDRVTLEPVKIAKYSDLLPELDGILSAAHAGIGEGEFYNFTLGFGGKEVYKLFKIDKNGHTSILAEIADAPAAYIHSVFLTGRFVVLVVWQCDFKNHGIPLLLNGGCLSVGTFAPWSQKRKALFFVVDRERGGVVARYQSDPFFAFHSLNAYDDVDASVVLDLAVFEDNSAIQSLTLDRLRSLETNPFPKNVLNTSPRRFRLTNIPAAPSSSSSSNPTPTSVPGQFAEAKIEIGLGGAYNIELPVVPPKVANKPYRYTYGIHWADESTENENGANESGGSGSKSGGGVTALSNAIIKLDIEGGTKKVWKRAGQVPGEPIFVPRPSASDSEGEGEGEGEEESAEDCGVLLTVSLDAKTGRSALVVLDAETMEEVASAQMEIPVPYGFHGAFTARM